MAMTLEEARQRLEAAEKEQDADDGSNKYRTGALRSKVGHWRWRVRELAKQRRQEELFGEHRQTPF